MMKTTLNATLSRRRITWRTAYTTALFLFGSLLLGFGLAIAASNLPMHFPEQTMNLISLLLLLAILFAGGALWGRAMARLTQSDQKRRLTWAGSLSFAPSLILAGIALSRLEFVIVERGDGPDLPVHVIFTLLFVPAAFFVASIGGLAIGIALKDYKLAVRLALGAGLAAALGFLLVDLVMDAVGYRVGAPGAAERATMLTVMMAGNLATSLAGGAALGFMLSSYPSQLIPPVEI
jgi:hypothetical protein